MYQIVEEKGEYENTSTIDINRRSQAVIQGYTEDNLRSIKTRKQGSVKVPMLSK